MPKGHQKSLKLVQSAPWGRPGSIACAICDVLGDVEKSMIFEVAPGSPKISKNRAKWAQGAVSWPRGKRKDPLLGARVPWAATHATRKQKRERRKEAKGKGGKGKWKSRKVLRDLTRPWARGPANLIAYAHSAGPGF